MIAMGDERERNLQKKIGWPKFEIMRALWPLKTFSIIVGASLFGQHSRSIRFLFKIYQGIVFGLIIGMTIHEEPVVKDWAVTNYKRSIFGILTFFQQMLKWFGLYFNFVLNVLVNEKVNQLLAELENTNIKLPRLSEVGLPILQIVQIAFHLTCSFGYEKIGNSWVLWKTQYHVSYTFVFQALSDFGNFTGGIIFVNMMLLLQAHYKGLNENLKKIRNFAIEDKLMKERICALRTSHMTLVRISKRMNKCYTFQLLLMFSLSIAELTYGIKYGIDYFVHWRDDTETLIMVSCWLFNYFIIILSICCAAELTSAECRRTGHIAHMLMNETSNDAEKAELMILSQQVKTEDRNFNIGIFFELSPMLVPATMAACFTYTVIILNL